MAGRSAPHPPRAPALLGRGEQHVSWVPGFWVCGVWGEEKRGAERCACVCR